MDFFEFLSQIEFNSMSPFWFLSFFTNFSYSVLFFAILDFEFCHSLSFLLLSQDEFLSYATISVLSQYECQPNICIMGGECGPGNLIYQGAVTRKDINHTDYDTGLSEPSWKLRYNNHNKISR